MNHCLRRLRIAAAGGLRKVAGQLRVAWGSGNISRRLPAGGATTAEPVDRTARTNAISAFTADCSCFARSAAGVAGGASGLCQCRVRCLATVPVLLLHSHCFVARSSAELYFEV
jgi:hypothetical protein